MQNLKGNPTRNAPDWSATTQAAIEFRSVGLPGNGTLTLSGDVNYQSRNYLTEYKKLVESAPGRTIVGAQLAYKTDSGVSVSVWGKNLTNEEFITSVTYINAAGALRLSSYFPPRTFGMSVGYDF